MKACDIQIELKNYKIRDGFLFKRSRIMREWRKRWIVLTINFLFSFQTEKCEKPTEIIDLKEVLSLRTMLKKTEDTYTNCLYIQTKTTDFALATNEANQKWSWIVTFERLMDFKERGASQYNNIDQIKTQGFESQDEFQFKQKSNVKSSPKVAKTISFQEEQKKKEMMADEILRKLLQQQEIMNKRQQSLLLLQKKIQQQRKIDLQYKLQAEQLSQKVQQLQNQLKQFRLQTNSLNKLSTSSDQKGTQHKMQTVLQQSSNIDPGNSLQQHRQQVIQFLFNEFQILQPQNQLIIIAQFFQKICQRQNFIYSSILQKQLNCHKLASKVILFLLERIRKELFQNENEIYRVVLLMNFIFRSNTPRQQNYQQMAEDIVINCSSTYTKSTQIDLLNYTIQLIKLFFKNSNYSPRQQMKKTVYNIFQLSQNTEFRANCNLVFDKLNE